jgi:hypothetical protein
MENGASFKERDVSLDVFKGFCLLLVMLIHIQAGKGATWLGAWANPFKLAGFFVVSGYLLSLKPCLGGFGDAVGRKWRGLMRPYFFFGFLALAVLVPLKANTLAGATSLSNAIISQMALLRGYSTLWFLPVLFVAEAFFIGTMFLENRLRSRFGRFAGLIYPLSALAAVCLSAFLSPLTSPYIKVPQNRQVVANLILTWLRALPAFVCVAAGYFAYGRLLAAVRRSAFATSAAGALLVAVGFSTGRMLGGIDWNNNVYGGNLCLFLVSGISSSLGLMLAFNLLSRHVRMPVMRFVGVNSLVLMATHLPLPFIQYAREFSAWLCVRVSSMGAFLSAHFLLNSLWILALVILLEIPLVLLLAHTPLKALWSGRRR